MSNYGGKRPGAGRKPGIGNAYSMEIKDMIRQALEKAGGSEYLLTQAKSNPAAFMSLIGKIIPKDVNSNITGEVALKFTEIQRKILKDDFTH